MPERIWVARSAGSDATARKPGKHGLDIADVRQALIGVAGVAVTWDMDSARGPRAIADVRISGRRGAVVLYEVEDLLGDVWALGRAYPE